MTGEGHTFIRHFLHLVPRRATFDDKLTEKPLFRITETFTVPQFGTVVSGVLAAGRVRLNDTLLLGPETTTTPGHDPGRKAAALSGGGRTPQFGGGGFVSCQVKGIHRQRVVVEEAFAGQSVTFALKKVLRSSIRVGMVLLGLPEKGQPMPRGVRLFEAELMVLYHSSSIKERYQAMVRRPFS